MLATHLWVLVQQSQKVDERDLAAEVVDDDSPLAVVVVPPAVVGDLVDIRIYTQTSKQTGEKVEGGRQTRKGTNK